ncbi:phytanoyl-CoA dioxygenase family protein [Paradesertivirga mongoliensis]|uniref:Phytanoyl-CoA dioxygenase family protein n=1 Tax=Paradesertivirga mongoliensis TaxID=2100740 RepID=A0ABW4ZI78_9SPHI|nr:phytanoyl-CoA dioxygenase family protein [Pedobacter mongoliensis]
MESITSKLNEKGFVIDNQFLERAQILHLETALVRLGAFDYCNNKVSSSSLLDSCEPVYNLANCDKIREFLRKLCREEMFPVKAFILDKTPENNWIIPWHQDLKIAVSKQIETQGYKNWSVEAGIPHVQPPAEVMSKLVTLRLHLDDCDETNGAINVIPGSHVKGIIPQREIPSILERSTKVLCRVKRFGIMFMNPLILHDSPYSTCSRSRRILQIEYGYNLGNGLQWH